MRKITDRCGMRPRSSLAVVAAVASFFAVAAPAHAGEEILETVTYEDTTTYSCRTNALPIVSGQNLNLFAQTKTCPNAQVISGEGDTSPFAPGSTQQGYITRFEPSMVEIVDGGGTVTPSVWDLHLHHVVWLKNYLGNNDGTPGSGPTFASGEEKTEVKMPQGYGIRSGGAANWGLNYMIHNLNASNGRQVYITWEIDWVPAESDSAADISVSTIRWLDVAGFPQAIYPVFDAEKGFDQDGDGSWTFPDDVPTDPSEPGYEEREKIANSRQWVLPGDRTLLFGAGHLHPGGTRVDLEVARDGADAGNTDGDDPSEVKQLFRSGAKYYEPAGAVSWDVSMEATRPEWRVSLKQGDTLSVNATYDVEKASWYESMGIMPVAVTEVDDPLAKDPFDDAAAVQAMYDQGGILTHGQLPENIDTYAGDDLGLPDPRKLKSGGKIKRGDQVEVAGFRYFPGGYSAVEDFPATPMRPPEVKAGRNINFLNSDALFGEPQNQQAWHSITSCKAPCNKDSGIGYPLANGPLKFDSGQLGYGTGTSQDVTIGSNEWTLKGGLPKSGKTYTYFCRIHPFMRGSIRTKEETKKGRGRV